MNDIIQIDTRELILAKDSVGKLTFSLSAKTELEKILLAKHLIDNLLEQVQGILKEEMDKENIKRIDAGNIKVSRKTTGGRYGFIGSEAVDERFTREIHYIIPNSEAIEQYVEERGELPKGVELRDRNEKVTIEEV